MTVSFSRAIGKRSGVQLNPISDLSEIGSIASDYNGAFAARLSRGRIDKVFAVTREQIRRLTGEPMSMTVSALGETQVHLYEALRYGAQQAIVARLVSKDAVLKLIAVTAAATPESGAVPKMLKAVSEAEGLPAGALLTLRHKECFNDGVVVEINAEAAETDVGAPAPSKVVLIRLVDPQTGKVILGPYRGSLSPTSADEFGNSDYIVDVVAKSTDLLEVVDVAEDASVPVACAFYGKADNKARYQSEKVEYFTEGPTVYTSAEIENAISRLKRSRPNFTYIGAGGTQNVALISALLDLGKDINKQVVWDVPGHLAPDAAATFYASIGGSTNSLYSQAFWAPIKSDNPLAGGKAYIGTSGQQIGLRCARNAQVNAKGIAPRNQPIAGSGFALSRTNITQTYEPTDDELEVLAESRINPCIFKDYSSGAKYAWLDSLTGAQTEGATKLIAVAEMGTWLDDKVTNNAQECLQKPMAQSISLHLRFLGDLLPALESAGWLQGTAELDGASYRAEVAANPSSPYDTMNSRYEVCYDGTNRVTIVQQTIVRAS